MGNPIDSTKTQTIPSTLYPLWPYIALMSLHIVPPIQLPSWFYVAANTSNPHRRPIVPRNRDSFELKQNGVAPSVDNDSKRRSKDSGESTISLQSHSATDSLLSVHRDTASEGKLMTFPPPQRDTNGRWTAGKCSRFGIR